jgi:predicted permease
MLRLFADNLLPVFLAAGAGYLVTALWKLDPRPLARVAFNVFAPCLVFQVIVDSRLPGEEFVRMAGFALTVLLTVAAAAGLAARLMGWARPMTAAVILVVLLPNAGNFGLPASMFAFGEDGLAQASVFFVMGALLSFTFGVFVASMGRASLGPAIVGLLKVPAIWSIAVAFLTLRMGWSLPLPLSRTVQMFSDASIPCFLVILGMQLYGNGWRGPVRPLALAAGARLVLSPAIGLVLVGLFGLAGPARQAGVLQAAMPAAVINIVLATEYDVEPQFVTSAVFATTLLSPITLTPLLSYLGA